MSNMGSILVREELLSKNDGAKISGLVYIRSYCEQPTKTGSSFLNGSLDCMGSVPFKVWRGTAFDKMSDENMQGKVCYIEGYVNEYNGQKSIIIESCSVSDNINKEDGTPISELDFLESRYDVNVYWSAYVKSIKSNCSEEAVKIFELIMSDYKEDFIKEFAAIYHHDNCLNGLLAHTTKVVKMLSLVKFYPEILNRVGLDLLVLGSALHDIGKVLEYSNGSISEMGKIISHNTIGILVLEEKKDKIIELKGEIFYYQLLAIVAQHHGEYGERPRTVASYVVHLFDCLDSQLTSINQCIEELPDKKGLISYDGLKLS